ncbi:uncharacterized protein FOMMEDRAFT_162869 [Fomitiporia mediterranea MF3/22]|uniref:Protein kinase domain-containing protein n=1 Tax=Fomitiporia mediterranea (strain MF3/22) TaxID=694068 RepID=R7SGL4_FOMME|nr:uncharacterized protein FOMMEDRAFT_162869 [Fomitiporia mediterranea MF3/22]EJC97565.1 hypothetical protein FOMMEDRAFT_162869 [Fomitiporia mediterranea MF3/22]
MSRKCAGSAIVTMEHGTALQYVMRNPAVDVPRLILGIAEGVQYLHTKGIVHSDIKSVRSLSASWRNAVAHIYLQGQRTHLAGSGYNIDTQSTSGGVKGSARWNLTYGRSELLTKKRPYHELANDLQVISAICNGCLPKTPEDFHTWPLSNQSAWELCNSCWSKDPSDRPGLQVIVWMLKATRVGNVVIMNTQLVCRELASMPFNKVRPKEINV